jgi:RNA polymerase sigma factor (TIGR02999 family)
MNDETLQTNIGEMSVLLERLEDGDTEEEVLRRSFAKLRRIAGAVVRQQGQGLSVEASDVLQEFYIRLKTHDHPEFHNTEDFFNWAWMKMKNVVWDYARRKHRTKRGGLAQRIDIDDVLGDLRLNGLATAEVAPLETLELQSLLEKLKERNRRDSELVDLYYFVGLSQSEIAERYGIAEEAVKSRLKVIRVWLKKEWSRGAGDAKPNA